VELHGNLSGSSLCLGQYLNLKSKNSITSFNGIGNFWTIWKQFHLINILRPIRPKERIKLRHKRDFFFFLSPLFLLAEIFWHPWMGSNLQQWSNHEEDEKQKKAATTEWKRNRNRSCLKARLILWFYQAEWIRTNVLQVFNHTAIWINLNLIKKHINVVLGLLSCSLRSQSITINSDVRLSWPQQCCSL